MYSGPVGAGRSGCNDLPGRLEPAVSTPAEPTGTIASALYRLRRRRERAFSTELFSEPSWDLMLDLLAAEKSNSRVSITSACIAAAAPTSTALRCLKLLEKEGLVYRERDEKDGRRTYVRLSPEAAAAMEDLIETLIQCFNSKSQV